MNELYNIFLRIKKHLHEKDFEKFDMPELVELILEEDKTDEDIQSLINVYEYIVKMEESLEDLGTTVLDISKIDINNVSVSDIELSVRNIILTVDQFIDGLAALMRTVEFTESKLKLKQSLAYLKSTRGFIISKTNEYKLKIKKSTLDTDTFIRFLTDTIDTFLREAYVIRILKIKEVILKTVDVDND